MWPRWCRHGTLGSCESKIFLLKYFWISFKKSYFYLKFYSKFQKRYHHKRKETQGSNPKNVSQKKQPRKNPPKTWVSSERVIEVAKIAFSLERLYGWFPIQWSHVQNHRVAPRSTQPFLLEISGNLVVKSKLPHRSDSSLEAVEPYP